MAYTIKDVFYLSTSAIIAASTANGGSAQLDLSAYIDPIARRRQKGTGLAVYKVHYSMGQASAGEPIDDAEAGSCRFGLLAGAGFGDVATGGLPATTASFAMTNDCILGCRLSVAQISLDQSTLNQLLRTQTV